MAKKKNNDVEIQVGANVDDFLSEIRKLVNEFANLNKILSKKTPMGLDRNLSSTADTAIKKVKTLKSELNGIKAPKVSFANFNRTLTTAINKVKRLQAELAKVKTVQVVSVEEVADSPKGQTKKRTAKATVNEGSEEVLSAPVQSEKDPILHQAQVEEYDQRKLLKDTDHKANVQALKEEFQQRVANEKEIQTIRGQALKEEFQQREANLRKEEKALKGLAKLRRDFEIANEVGKPIGHAAYLRKQDAESMYQEQLRSLGSKNTPSSVYGKAYEDYKKAFEKPVVAKVDTKQANVVLDALASKLKSLRDRVINVKIRQLGGQSLKERSTQGDTLGSMLSNVGNVAKNLNNVFSGAQKGGSSVLAGASSAVGRGATALGRVAGPAGMLLTGSISALVKPFQVLRGIIVETGTVMTNFAAAVNGLREVFNSTLGPGFDFTRNMETSKLGIAGILASMGKLNGKAVEFQDAMRMSDEIFKKLQADAMRTAASTEELVDTYQGLLAPGLGSGLKADEIRQYTTTGVNMAKAMGLDQTQFVQELRDMLQGGIQAGSSTIARALGLTDADIKKAQASAEGLFKFLMNRMSGANAMAEEFPKTINGMLSQIKEFGTQASKVLSDQFIGEIRFALQSVRDLFGKFSKETGEFEVNPKFKELADALREVYIWILECIDSWTAFYEKLDDAGVIDSIIGYFKTLIGLAYDMGKTIKEVIELSVDFWKAFELPDSVKNAFSWLNNELTYILSVAKKLITTLGELAAIPFAGIETPKYFSDFSARFNQERQKPRGTKLASEARDRWAAEVEKANAEKKKNKGSTDVDKVVSKYPNDNQAKEALKIQKDALRKQTDLIKRNLEKMLEIIKDAFEDIELQYKQNQISLNEYLSRQAQLNVNKEKEEIKAIQAQISAVQNSKAYADEKEREQALQPLQWALEDHQKALAKTTKAQEGIARQIEHFTNNGVIPLISTMQQAQSGGGDVNGSWINNAIETGVNNNLGQVSLPEDVRNGCVAAVRIIGSYWNEWLASVSTNWIPTLQAEAAKAKIPEIPYDENKLDPGDTIVFDKDEHVMIYKGVGANGKKRIAGNSSSVGYMIERDLDNQGQRPTSIIKTGTHGLPQGAYGQNLGGTSLDLNDLKATTQAEYEAKQKLKEFRDKVRAFTGDHLAVLGDISTTQIETLIEQYAELKEFFEVNGLTKEASQIERVLRSKKNELEFSQANRNLDTVLDVLDNNVKNLKNRVTVGMESFNDTIVKYLGYLDGTTENYLQNNPNFPEGQFDIQAQLDKLYNQLSVAEKVGNIAQANEIRSRIDAIVERIQAHIDDVVSTMEARISWENSMIDANYNLTEGQKASYKEENNRGLAQHKAESYKQLADTLWRDADILAEKRYQAVLRETGDVLQAQIAKEEELANVQAKANLAQQQAAYNEELGRTHTLLEKAGNVARQSIEDGLNKFLTDGINNARSLGEAFRDLISSILLDLQKMFAKEIVKDLMDRWFGRRINKEVGTVDENGNPIDRITNGNMGLATVPERQAAERIQAAIDSGQKTVPAESLVPGIGEGEVAVQDVLDRLGATSENFMEQATTSANSLSSSLETIVNDLLGKIDELDNKVQGKITEHSTGGKDTVTPNAGVEEGFSSTATTVQQVSMDLQNQVIALDTGLQTAGQQMSMSVQNLASSLPMEVQTLATSIQSAIMQLIIAIQSANAQMASAGSGAASAGGGGGGSTAGFATGGYIQGPGTGTSDSIPAMLSNGEFVVRAQAVKKFGVAALKRINEGRWGNISVNVPKFAGGGLVGDAGAEVAEKFGFVNTQPVVNTTTTVKNYVDGRAIFDTYGREMVRSEVKKQTIANAKINSMLGRRV